MDSLSKNFEIVLRKVLLPMFPQVSDVEVEPSQNIYGVPLSSVMIMVVYTLQDKFTNADVDRIKIETKSFFSLMGFDERYYIGPSIHFKNTQHIRLTY